jgi:spore coat protein U-like protein
MKNVRFALTLGFLVLTLTARPLFAATSTASFSVTATVQATCQVSISAKTAKDYTAALMASAASNVSVICTKPTPYSVHFSQGLTANAVRKTAGAASAMLGYLSPDSPSGANADSAVVTITY